MCTRAGAGRAAPADPSLRGLRRPAAARAGPAARGVTRLAGRVTGVLI
ncbi:hypothetical protein Ae406Ps2_2454 [Pseudonocardia sp. Ae406_Ps2]|nr:hypothetical protein Ae331Ps2_3463c [Pseudonocardia sp. Ae331_Ps2]OLM02454.1 hypothetical protein Ae406Ps2_2454 [Pseudonocardia sp. Ae406_Ps2]OLM24026.1 hypothetical protein Ae706Ps2_2459 [Pseudonocardia sp. Ae706_Ps2]